MMAWIKRWGPAVFFMAVIFLISGTPGSELPEFGVWDILAKKGGHLLGYAVLGSASYYGVNYGRSATIRHFILAALMTILYAVSDEWHQKYVPGRNSSFLDICIDAIGGLIGIAIICLLRKSQSNRHAAADSCSK